MSRKLLSLGIAAGILIPNIVLAEQVVIQQGSSNATAVGDRNYAGSSIHQSSTQNQHAKPDAYVNEQRQSSIQQGYSNSAAEGNNNEVVSNIEQNSLQDQDGNYRDSHHQSGIQNATDNATAVGNNNRITNHTRQYNRQNQWSY
ncbi:MAG: hypothetical protein ACFCAD_07565 [Pleurocapsa sp.]